MTFGHWLYTLGIIVVVITMVLRRNVLIPCILFTFLLGWSFFGSISKGIQTIFNASIVAGSDLLGIFMIIGLMVALLKSLSVTGTDEMMVVPLKRLMHGPLVSYLVLAGTTLIVSMFFWPTPAVPLVGALLAPLAIKMGLSPMLAAMAIALAGQGLALGGDVIIQGAPGLTAASAGVPVEMVTLKGGILSLITGVIALTLAYIWNKKDMYYSKMHPVVTGIDSTTGEYKWTPKERSKGRTLLILLLISMVYVIFALFKYDLKGGDASAMLGGVALLVAVIASLYVSGRGGLDQMADYLADGLVFAFRVMGPIIPIAGFFFLGNPETSAKILAEGAPGYLFDLGKMLSQVIPPTGFLAAFGLLFVGLLTGLDGSGFSGLPLVGTLAGAMASGDLGAASTLASIGQIGAIWSGGGTLIAWCSLVAVAGIVGVPVLELVRKNFLPVMIGLSIAVITGVMFMM